MLIIKDGISREVSKRNLHEYLEKGYVLVETPTEKEPEKKETPVKKKTVQEKKG